MPTGYGEAGFHQHAGKYRPPNAPPPRGRSKGMDPTDISHAKQPFYQQAQFVPYGNEPTLADLFPDIFHGGGGGGGGGHGRGFDFGAAARAAEEKRKAAMRAAIQQQYGGAINNLTNLNRETTHGLGVEYNAALSRFNPIYAQNRALTGDYSRQLNALAQHASQGVLDQGGALARDIRGQGGAYGLGALQGRISGDVHDILGANSAANQYNTRLAQVMGVNQADNRALLNAILQGAQSTRQNTYAQQLNQLRGDQAMKLAELA